MILLTNSGKASYYEPHVLVLQSESITLQWASELYNALSL